jgi:hypothetical protein
MVLYILTFTNLSYGTHKFHGAADNIWAGKLSQYSV